MAKKTENVKKIDGLSADVRQEKINALMQLVPEAFSDGKIDVKRLRTLVGEEVVTEDERYRLEWAGKSEVFDEIAERSSCTLTLDEKRSSKDWENSNNIFIEGENLEVLRTLQKAYYGKVKMIYIDPPYNTGHDFVYNDNFRETEGEYCDDECNVDENGLLKKAFKLNSRDSGRFHSNWLSMMYPRLYLARNLLRDDGVIFVSIDDNEVHNLQHLMNEIFGEENFIADVVMISNLKGRNDKKYIATAHERLLMYVKSDLFEESGLRLPEARLEDFDQEDEIGKFRLLGLRKRGGPDTRRERPNMYFPIYVNPDSGEVSLEKSNLFTEEVLPAKSNGEDGRWRWGSTTVGKRLTWLFGKKVSTSGKFDVFEKDYLETEGEIRRIKPKSVMYSKEYSTDSSTKAFRAIMPGAGFENPKSVIYIKDLIDYSTKNNSEDIILDFFSGSGTTAHAVMQLNAEDDGNRKYLCIQMPEDTPENSVSRNAGYNKISSIALDRIKKASAKIKTEHLNFKGDLGVRVYKETESHFPQWHSQVFKSDADLEQAVIEYSKAELQGTPFDRATEVLLKLGYSLTTEIVEKDGYMMADDEVALVLDVKFSLKNLQKVLDASPKTIIVLEKLFKKDDEKINFALRCKEADVIFQTV